MVAAVVVGLRSPVPSQLSMYRGQLEEASGFLHQAVVLAHQTNNQQGIIYTYSLVRLTSDLRPGKADL